ncbi:hypothetical protein D3C77_179760 [compost metagenome]
MAVVVVLVAAAVLARTLFLSWMWPPSSARAALAATAPRLTATSLASIRLPAPVAFRPWLALTPLVAPVVLITLPWLRLMVPPSCASTPTEPLDRVLTLPPTKSMWLPLPLATRPWLFTPPTLPPRVTLLSRRDTWPPLLALTPVMLLVVISALLAVLGTRLTVTPLPLSWPPLLACRPVWPAALAALCALLLTVPPLKPTLLAPWASTPMVRAAARLTMVSSWAPAVAMPMLSATITLIGAGAPSRRAANTRGASSLACRAISR